MATIASKHFPGQKRTCGEEDEKKVSVPVKYSPNSCSSFIARSWVLRACSSVMRLFHSLRGHKDTVRSVGDGLVTEKRTKRDLHDGLDGFRFDEHGDRIQLRHLQPFDGVAADVQYTMLTLVAKMSV